MSKQYSLENLEIGMRVKLSEVSNIRGATLVLRKSSMDYTDGDPCGELIYIGDDWCKHVDSGDAVLINNYEEDDIWED